MRSTSKRAQSDYSVVLKLVVIDQAEKGDFTYNQVLVNYRIYIGNCFADTLQVFVLMFNTQLLPPSRKTVISTLLAYLAQ